MKERDFIYNKKETLEKLKNAIFENKVDEEIIPILNLINSNNNYYTSSSCYGRIVLLELPKIGDKKNAKFLGKWHRKIDSKELEESLKDAEKGELWFLAQAPIIHVHSKDLDSGDELVKKAVLCGFKNSGFRSIKKNIVIELSSTERIDMPIGNNGEYFFKKDFTKILVEFANEVIEKSIKKLKKFEKLLSNK